MNAIGCILFFIKNGWVIRIRTLIDGVRVRSPAVGRSPNSLIVELIQHDDF